MPRCNLCLQFLNCSVIQKLPFDVSIQQGRLWLQMNRSTRCLYILPLSKVFLNPIGWNSSCKRHTEPKHYPIFIKPITKFTTDFKPLCHVSPVRLGFDWNRILKLCKSSYWYKVVPFLFETPTSVIININDCLFSLDSPFLPFPPI